MHERTSATGAAKTRSLPRRIPGVVIHIEPNPSRPGQERYWVTHYGKLIAAPQRSFDVGRAQEPGNLIQHAGDLIDRLFDNPYEDPTLVTFRPASQMATQLRLVLGGLSDGPAELLEAA